MNHDDSDPKPAKRRRWRMRFGLGTILLLTTVVCGLLGVWSYYIQPYRTTAMLRERILELDGFYATNPCRGPRWQGDLVEYLVGSGAFVDLIQIDLESKAITGEDVRLIGQMRNLKSLNLDRTGLDDQGALMLASMQKLSVLSARYTAITDHGASALVNAPNLHTIRWTGCDVTDRALEAIPPDTNLTQVFARWSDVTEAGVARTQQRIADCQVYCTGAASSDG